MEYLRTNSLPTASISFNQAKEIYDKDPIVHNEIGVTLYKQKKYTESKEVFSQALPLCNESVSWIQETILGNLGHSYRKLGDHKAACYYYEKCLVINPKNDSILFALAFTYHITHQ